MSDRTQSGAAPVRGNALLSFLKYAAVIVVFLNLLGAAALLFIYPLWYLATSHRDVYSVIVLLAFSPLLLVFVLRGRRALRNGVFAEFAKKTAGLFSFLLFLCAQALWAILHIVLFALLRSAEPLSAAVWPFVPATAAGAFLIPALAGRLRKVKLARQSLTVFYAVIFALQAAYWLAVFIYHGFWPHTVGIISGILGFFFLLKISKIRREKKNPDDQAERG